MSEPADRIADVSCRLLVARLSRPWGADVTTLSVIAVTVRSVDGREGHGFSWTPTIGARAVIALLENDIASFVHGRTIDPEALWPLLWQHLHEAGGGGLTTIAMAGVDLALWDLRATDQSLGFVDLLGARRESVGVYGSGVNLHYSLEDLVAQAERWVAAGFSAAKIKVGKPDLREDVDRVAAVREVLGPDRRLMLDANQRWDLPTATRAIAALAVSDPFWIEEPLLSDDLAAHVELRLCADVPVALGENLYTAHRFREAIDSGACDIVQPNVIRVGGITPFRTIAALAEDRAVPLYPHLLPEISGPLALTLGAETMVESVEGASFAELGLLADPGPVTVGGGILTLLPRPGLGLRFRLTPRV